jgi:hypothetical protein
VTAADHPRPSVRPHAYEEDIVRWINRTYDNEETNRDYRVALSVFGRRTSDENGDDPPESIEWVPSGRSSNTVGHK